MGSAKIDKQISQNWVEKEQTKGKEKKKLLADHHTKTLSKSQRENRANKKTENVFKNV